MERVAKSGITLVNKRRKEGNDPDQHFTLLLNSFALQKRRGAARRDLGVQAAPIEKKGGRKESTVHQLGMSDTENARLAPW